MGDSFQDSQLQFWNWFRGDNAFHGEKDVWRLNSYNMNTADFLNENITESELLGVGDFKTRNVVGSVRANFFRHLTSGQSVFFPPTQFNMEEYSCVMPPIKEKFRDASVQTKYRESSVQTSPFEPEFIPDEEGKYLDLEIYSLCKTIRDIEEPGQYEVTLIERLKRRRSLEKLLSTCINQDEIHRYHRIIETFEWEEWIAREDDIQYYQNLRLKIVKDLLEEKNSKMRSSSDQKVLHRIEQIRQKCEKEKAKIESKYNRNMRKIEYKRKNIPRKYTKVDILLEHTKMDSELYAPQMRYGVHPKRRHFVGYKTKFDLRMEDLEQKMVKPSIVKCPFAYTNELAQPKKPPKEYTTSFLTDKRLKVLYENLKHFRIKLEPKHAPPQCLKMKKILSTDNIKPTIFGVDQDIQAEEEYQKCIYLQKLLKGRAIQNILYTGKEEFKGLIHEIDSTHSLRPVEALFPDISTEKESKKARTLARQKYSEQVLNDGINLKTILRDFEGSVIGPMFEFLQKELDRLFEQKRVHAIVMLAEQERFKRQAKEAGTRQYENRLREQYVETYTHMVKATKDNATTYLEDVLLDEINMKASVDCRRKVSEIAQSLDKYNEEMIDKAGLNMSEKRQNEEKLIAEIVNNFLLSNAHNQLTRQNVYLQRKKNIEAINKTLYAEYRIAQDVLNDILQDIIKDVVKCPSPEEFYQESLKEFVKNIIKNTLEDTLDDSNRSIPQILTQIMDALFNDNKSVFMDERDRRDFVRNVIITYLKKEIDYTMTDEDKCLLDQINCNIINEAQENVDTKLRKEEEQEIEDTKPLKEEEGEEQEEEEQETEDSSETSEESE